MNKFFMPFMAVMCMAAMSVQAIHAEQGTFEKRSKCILVGETQYSSHLKEYLHNKHIPLENYYIQHKSGYSRKLDTCLLSISFSFREGPYKGHVWYSVVKDALENNVLYSMTYEPVEGKLVPAPDSSFRTEEEFERKKQAIFLSK